MKNIAEIIPVDPLHPASEAIARAAGVIRAGGVVIVPTSGLYGLAADALKPEAVERLFRIKHRDPVKPILVLIAAREMLHQVAEPVSDPAAALMDAFWPGRVTFVLRARAGLPAGLTSGGRIGVRLAAHPVARELIRAAGSPLTGTSANLAGGTGCAALAEIDAAVRDAADLALDAGRLGGTASSVVDVTGERPVILREGAVPARAIMAAFRRIGGTRSSRAQEGQ